MLAHVDGGWYDQMEAMLGRAVVFMRLEWRDGAEGLLEVGGATSVEQG